jgi:hypothetical protein
LLLGAPGSSPETVQIANPADSGTDSAAVDTAGIQAKLNLVSNTASSRSEAPANAINSTCRGSPRSAVRDSSRPDTRRASNAAGSIANTLTYAVGPGTDASGSDNQRGVLAGAARPEANTRPGNTSAPIDDDNRSRTGVWRLRLRKHRGTANKGHCQGYSQSTAHFFLRMPGQDEG